MNAVGDRDFVGSLAAQVAVRDDTKVIGTAAIGIKAFGGNPDNAGRGAVELRDAARLRLTALVTEGSAEIPVGPSFPLTSAAEVLGWRVIM